MHLDRPQNILLSQYTLEAYLGHARKRHPSDFITLPWSFLKEDQKFDK